MYTKNVFFSYAELHIFCYAELLLTAFDILGRCCAKQILDRQLHSLHFIQKNEDNLQMWFTDLELSHENISILAA